MLPAAVFLAAGFWLFYEVSALGAFAVKITNFGFGLRGIALKETREMTGDCGIIMQNINGGIKPEIILEMTRMYLYHYFDKMMGQDGTYLLRKQCCSILEFAAKK